METTMPIKQKYIFVHDISVMREISSIKPWIANPLINMKRNTSKVKICTIIWITTKTTPTIINSGISTFFLQSL